MQIGTTLTRFIVEEERQHPEATGEFTGLVTELASTAKIISREDDIASGRPYSARYIGSLVADFHRNLLKGGIFLYPGDAKSPRGKLRLLYEAAPLAFIVEQAGGAASDGEQPIMDLQASELHQRTPLFIGSCEDVATLEDFAQGKRAPEGLEGIRASSV